MALIKCTIYKKLETKVRQGEGGRVRLHGYGVHISGERVICARVCVAIDTIVHGLVTKFSDWSAQEEVY